MRIRNKSNFGTVYTNKASESAKRAEKGFQKQLKKGGGPAFDLSFLQKPIITNQQELYQKYRFLFASQTAMAYFSDYQNLERTDIENMIAELEAVEAKSLHEDEDFQKIHTQLGICGSWMAEHAINGILPFSECQKMLKQLFKQCDKFAAVELALLRMINTDLLSEIFAKEESRTMLLTHSLPEVYKKYFSEKPSDWQNKNQEYVDTETAKKARTEADREAAWQKRMETAEEARLYRLQNSLNKPDGEPDYLARKLVEDAQQQLEREQQRERRLQRERELLESKRKQEEAQQQARILRRQQEQERRRQKKEEQRLLAEKEEQQRREREQLRRQRWLEEQKRQAEKRRLRQQKLEETYKNLPPEYQELRRQGKLKDTIVRLTSDRPEQLYPEARSMKRKFFIHVGPTNSGKTHDSLERLKTSSHGGYFGPLRLLAMEVFDRFNMEMVPCSLITGEESILIPNEICKACTVEMLNLAERFDIVVLDECQMLQDSGRGHFWTEAILGLQADEIHLCMAAEALDLVTRIIDRCGDSYEVIYHVRKTRLIMEEQPFSLKKDIRPGDALIVFSQRKVKQIAWELHDLGYSCSVIYGSLPPNIRREQVRRYTEGETNLIVSTDAIGMGLNLPIRRIVFIKMTKFDGIGHRPLRPGEIRQIAGRAGRYGMYDEGYVTTVENQELLREAMHWQPPQAIKAYIGFPRQLLDIDETVYNLMTAWKQIDPPPLYEKINLDEPLYLYQEFEKLHSDDLESFSNDEIYRLIHCPVSTNDPLVMDLWRHYCCTYYKDDQLTFPSSPRRNLYGLESYHKMLELYVQFSRAMRLPIDEERLEMERNKLERELNNMMTQMFSKKRKCKKCGAELPMQYNVVFCEKCFRKYAKQKLKKMMKE